MCRRSQEKCAAEKEKTIANRKTWFYVYFDMSIGGEPAGRILMSLRTDKTPKVRAQGMGS
jgi:hypothetical protein